MIIPGCVGSRQVIGDARQQFHRHVRFSARAQSFSVPPSMYSVMSYCRAFDLAGIVDRDNVRMVQR
jgi:hypothetical protein